MEQEVEEYHSDLLFLQGDRLEEEIKIQNYVNKFERESVQRPKQAKAFLRLTLSYGSRHWGRRYKSIFG